MSRINASKLILDMGLSPEEITSRLHIARVDEGDIERIRSVGELIDRYSEVATDAFIGYLDESPDTCGLLDDATRKRIRRLKRAHVQEMGRGEYGEHYVEQRLELALLYSEIGLPLRWFFGAFHHLVRTIGRHLLETLDPQHAYAAIESLNKLSIFDGSLMGDVLVFLREQTIRSQEEAIRELSTPVLRIRDRLLILPVIGAVDRERARLLTDGLLRGIRDHRARVVIIDVTGVPDVDSDVANHLVHAVEASRLMGATVILTGLAAEIAHTLVTLGVELRGVHTVGDLQGGLEEGERLMGYMVKRRSRSTSDRGRASLRVRTR